VGDLSVLADLQRVGAGGGEGEGPDRLAVVDTVVAAEVAGNLDDVQSVVAGQGAVQGTGEGLAGQRRAAGQVPFLVKVGRGVAAEQNAVIEGDGGRDGKPAGPLGAGGRDQVVQQEISDQGGCHEGSLRVRPHRGRRACRG
jgi:hypothetical protein